MTTGAGKGAKAKHTDRIHAHINYAVKQRLNEYAALKGQTQASVIEAALQEYLDDEARSTLVLRELKQLRRGLNRVERNMDVLDAALAGYVQLWLAYNPPLPEAQKVHAQRMATQRFEQLLTFLQNQLRQRRTFTARLGDETLQEQEMLRELLDQVREQRAQAGEGGSEQVSSEQVRQDPT